MTVIVGILFSRLPRHKMDKRDTRDYAKRQHGLHLSIMTSTALAVPRHYRDNCSLD